MKAYAESRTPVSARDRRGTPPGLVDLIEQRLRVSFVLDVCAEEHTAQARTYFDRGALDINWGTHINHDPEHRVLAASWMNPPYSDPFPWLRKAVVEASLGTVTVALLPDDRSTKWYREAVKPYASAMLVTDRRIPFLDENGIPQFGNPKGSIIPVFAPWRLGWIEQTLEIPNDLMKRWRAMGSDHD